MREEKERRSLASLFYYRVKKKSLFKRANIIKQRKIQCMECIKRGTAKTLEKFDGPSRS